MVSFFMQKKEVPIIGTSHFCFVFLLSLFLLLLWPDVLPVSGAALTDFIVKFFTLVAVQVGFLLSCSLLFLAFLLLVFFYARIDGFIDRIIRLDIVFRIMPASSRYVITVIDTMH